MFAQFARAENPYYQISFVKSSLQTARDGLKLHSPTLLDVGAGTGRFRAIVRSLGYVYFAQDFGAYQPSDSDIGLQDNSWAYTSLDYECDILDIPDEAKADVILCSEVLEHVPDPVRAFEKLFNLARPGGFVIVTVPFLSLMHQAPHFYSSGLSPFWFHVHAARLGFEDVEVSVWGDYFDLMRQEIDRTFSHEIFGVRILFYPLWLLARGGLMLARQLAPPHKAGMAGFGVSFFGRVSQKQ